MSSKRISLCNTQTTLFAEGLGNVNEGVRQRTLRLSTQLLSHLLLLPPKVFDAPAAAPAAPAAAAAPDAPAAPAAPAAGAGVGATGAAGVAAGGASAAAAGGASAAGAGAAAGVAAAAASSAAAAAGAAVAEQLLLRGGWFVLLCEIIFLGVREGLLNFVSSKETLKCSFLLFELFEGLTNLFLF